ncbi:hypothetical protein AeNC1_007926 [Aphanomyces euteiches]|nr:hypothetical protein AeNC1_007926 [Aphanomyces euteiches]
MAKPPLPMRMPSTKAANSYLRLREANLDETAYFYCTAQASTICTSTVTSNAVGSCKWLLLFIGTAKQPRCFGSRLAEELDLEYSASKKGMTATVFHQWIEKFNAAMQDEGRHVLLLLDNASPHRLEETLSHVAVRMLPPNTTAFLQPQDAGIIQAFKRKLAVLRAQHIVDKFDLLLDTADEAEKENFASLVNKLHDVTLLQALEWAKEAWRCVSQDT